MLKKQGWCFWECEALDGDIITIVRNNARLSEGQERHRKEQLITLRERHKGSADPKWFGAVYTEDELTKLSELDDPRLVHEAKRMGAEIT